jgi:hypothetical protein
MDCCSKKDHALCGALAGLLLLNTITPLAAQTFSGAWKDLGPGPAVAGQVEQISNREVVGAINAFALHPTDANIIYAGGTNGGLWKTTNATAASPTWQPIGDSQKTLSIGALEFDPTDASNQTLLAGIGRTSSLGRISGSLIGLLRTTNGGSSWAQLDAAGALVGRDINSVAARGPTLVLSTDTGVFRSTDTGASATQISSGSGATTGLPAGRTSDMIGDKLDPTRLFVSLVTAPSGGSVGIYRSQDTGANWTLISDATLTAAMAGAVRVEMSRGASNSLFVAVVDSTGKLSNVFRSPDLGATWTAMGVPTTVEDGGILFGIHPGGQGSLHLSIAADPTDANVVCVGGDRQPYFSEGNGGSNFFPNSLGAVNYTGRLFRGDAAQPEATRWKPLTHSGTANSSSPHADSREMFFDPQGNIVESDDGGIYKRTLPNGNTGVWLSLNGSLQSTEFHAVSYDTLADRVIGGAQDTGASQQQSAATKIFDSVASGDGGDTAVSDLSPSVSTRYSSSQSLQSFRRRTYNAANVLQSSTAPALALLAGSPAPTGQFYTPISTNDVDGTRLVIAATNGVYESFDQGDSITRLITNRANANSGGNSLIYGVPGNPEFLYFASTTGLFLRTSAAPTLPTQVNTLSATVRDVAADRTAPARLFAITDLNVFFSSDSGANFANINGNLAALDTGDFRSLVYVPATDGALVLGASRGVFFARSSTGFTTWARLGTGLPNALTFDLDYDVTDQVLIAGQLGRGAWRLDLGTAADTLFKNGFE